MRTDLNRPAPGSSDRTRLRRLPEKAGTDRGLLYAILDAGTMATVGIADPTGQPYVLPVAYARDGDHVVCHGSTGSRLFRTLAQGAPACLAVTIVDGLILARSAFEHSMRYRSALVLGRAEAVVDEAAKLAALRRISDHLVPGRWAQVRQPNEKELAATLVVRLPLDECSVKVSAGSPQDAAEDLDFPVWAGVVPISTSYGEPEPEPGVSLPPPRLP